MDVILLIEGGPMDGQRFRADFLAMPPPSRLLGSDIHRDLCGLYELKACMHQDLPPECVYVLREDDDYHRIKRAHDRIRVVRRLEGTAG